MQAYKLIINNPKAPDEIAFTRIYSTLKEAATILNQFKRADISGTIVDCMSFKEITGETEND
tara:strand:+ start:391 stop:576 length:186 start_codon:yes stop_codon:yes gene_type:complete